MLFENMKNYRQQTLQAESILAKPCFGSRERFHTGNCQHCELRKKAPNYSGWGRIYVQTNRPIGKDQFEAFMKELTSTNKAYRKELIDDIIYYGLSVQ
jgi:hypothetical protein